MGLIPFVSVLIRLLGIGWSLVMMKRLKDWRMGLFTLFFLLMAVRQSLTMAENWQGFHLHFYQNIEEFPGLLVSIISLLALFGLERMIEEYRRTKERDRRQFSVLESTLNSTQDGILVTDLSGKIISYNERFARMWRIPKNILDPRDDDQAIAFVLDQLKYPEKFVEKIRQLYGQVDAVSFDTLEFKDGRVFERYSTPQLMDGRAAGRVWSFRDVSDRVRAEAERSEYQRILETLMGNLPGMVYRCKNDPQWTMIFVGGRVEELTGYAVRDLLDGGTVTYAELIHPDDRQKVWDDVQRAVELKESFDLIYRIRDCAGRGKWVCERGAGIFNQSGELLFLEGFIMDITTRKKLEERLVTSRDRLRRLSAHLEDAREEERLHISREIHDELGQELMALKMFTAQLGKHLDIPSNRRPRLRRLFDNAQESIDRIIQNVRRISSSLRPALLDDLGLTAAIEWQTEQFQKYSGVRCQLHLPPDEPDIGDERKTAVFRIFQETLTNVARHSNATRAKIELSRQNGELVLMVEDNGKGLPDKKRRSADAVGIIGMQERARQVGGEIKFDNPEKGKGTRVILRLPVGQSGRPEKSLD